MSEYDEQPDVDPDDVFEPILRHLDDGQRAEVVAAYVAVESAAEPVPEVKLAALREPASRRRVARLLGQVGRTLVKTPRGWTSGYADDVTAALATDERARLSKGERAVLTLILIHSVAIPRSQNKLTEDSWLSPHPTSLEELQRRSMLGVGALEDALRRLRTAGLVSQIKTLGDTVGGYVPGPQFHRLTPKARARLQEELILAAGPDSPLSASIRARRRAQAPARPRPPAAVQEVEEPAEDLDRTGDSGLDGSDEQHEDDDGNDAAEQEDRP